MKRIFFFIALSITASLFACGGGGSGSSSGGGTGTPPPPTVFQGRFVDAPVQGISYTTATQSGITDENGYFNYQQDEVVSFKIGDLLLGSAKPNPQLTPVDLVTNGTTSNPTVINISRLLQSLDSAANTNTITIPAGVLTNAATSAARTYINQLDFANSSTFDSIAGNLLAVLTSGVSAYSSTPVLVAVDKARAHLEASLRNTLPILAPTNGLVAYYPFNGNAMDASGNGHHGNVVRAALTSDRSNNADRAYYFNGKDSQIDVTPNDAFAPNQFTICAMVSIEEQVTTNCCPRIVHRMSWAPCKVPGDPCNGTGYDLHYQKFGENNYNSILSFNFFDRIGKELNVVSPPKLEYGKWYQVAVTYDENIIKFYFNGILFQSKTVTSPIAHTPGVSFFIGSDGGVGTFKGKIDEVYFYNRALTDNEILQFKKY